MKIAFARPLVLSIFALTLAGCATQAPTLNFVPEDVLPIKNKVAAELKTITVSIAKEDERLGETQVGFFGNQYEVAFKSSFKEALEEALAKSAAFNDLADRKVSLTAKVIKVSLTAKVIKFESPSGGINFDTDLIVRYELFDRASGQLVYRRDIASQGSVPFDYAFMGAIRFTEARNRAVRQNVLNFISSLEEIKLADVSK